jgi:DNA replication regulator DPB11
MWAERCLQSKRFFEPDEHVLSRPLQVFPIPGFERLVINSTGLPNIDLLHVSKAVKILGAKYDQILKPGISVLLCYPSTAGEDKLRHAHKWHIPAVSLEWLWSCIRLGKMQSFGTYLLEQGQTSKDIILDRSAVVSARQSNAVYIEDERHIATNQPRAEPILPPKNAARCEPVARDAPESNRMLRAAKANSLPGEGFLKSPQRKDHASELRHGKGLTSTDLAATADRGELDDADDEKAEIGLPLQEVHINSPPRSEMVLSPRHAHLVTHFNGQSIPPDKTENDDTPSAPEATSTGKTTYMPPQPDSIKGAIKELLGKSRTKNTVSAMPIGENKKKRLLGRALSNVSNSSREGSNIRASRASSIDSVNTDGLGSVILDETSQNHRIDASGANGRSTCTQRAFGRNRHHNESSFELGDAALYREEYPEEEEPPQMTQLGYENPEDAVALREMLAERRRNRTRNGQEDIKCSDSKEEKKIKDDVTVAGAGWGHGRRTRRQAKQA